MNLRLNFRQGLINAACQHIPAKPENFPRYEQLVHTKSAQYIPIKHEKSKPIWKEQNRRKVLVSCDIPMGILWYIIEGNVCLCI